MIIYFDDIRGRLPAAMQMMLGKPDKERHGSAILSNGKRVPQYYFRAGAGFDCETTKTPKGYSYVYAWQFSLNNYEVIGRRTEDFETFLLALDDYLFQLDRWKNKWHPDQQTQLLIFDANMGYEFAHFKRVFGRVGMREVFAKDRRHPLKLNVGRCLEFRECLGVFGFSLANIAETYTKTQKKVGDLDYSKQRNSLTPLEPAELGYLQNDVAILSELCFVAFDMFPKSIPLTGTGIIRNAVKEKLMQQGKMSMEFAKERTAKLMPETLAEYNVMMDYLYCGGWAHSYFPLIERVLPNVRCADLVSDFPAQMFQHSFPAGSLLRNCCVADMEKFPHWYALFTFYDVRTKYNHSFISEHKCIDLDGCTLDNGRVWKADMMQVYLNEVDYSNFCWLHTFNESMTEVQDIHCFTRSERITPALLDTLKEQYRKKNQLKAEGKGHTREYAESKKFVNGCYGMCATRIYLENVVIDETGADLKEVPSEKGYKELIKNIWLSPWIAIYTTSYAREILVYFVTEYPELIVQYDTDSIYYRTDQPLSAELEKDIDAFNDWKRATNNKIFDNDLFFESLGTWERDPVAQRFKCLGAKRYIKEVDGKIKVVCAGMKEKAFLEYCKRNDYDPFDYFGHKLYLFPDDSGKTTLKYYDGKQGVYKDTITDEYGNTEKVTIETCGVITEIPFGLYMSEIWREFVRYQVERMKKL